MPLAVTRAPETAATPPAPVATAPAVTSGRACPNCGHENGPDRRFCGHCGQVLATGAPARGPEPRRRGWWSRLLRSDTRLARRAYRRSLPPLYRWRRVGVTALIAAVVLGGFAVVGSDPVGWTMDRWYDVTNRLDPVRDVGAQALPEDSVIGDNDPNGLLDADPTTAWVTGWTPPEGRPSCGDGRGGRVVLTFPETRVRELHVITGVTDPSDRPLQHIPTQLHVQLPDGTCRTVDLTRAPELQEVPFDTERAVGRLTISIGETYTGDDERIQDVAGLSQLTLLARP
nr:zinc ribbon domain-containing protein [Ornithinimicrobium sp. F0845]